MYGRGIPCILNPDHGGITCYHSYYEEMQGLLSCCYFHTLTSDNCERALMLSPGSPASRELLMAAAAAVDAFLQKLQTLLEQETAADQPTSLALSFDMKAGREGAVLSLGSAAAFYVGHRLTVTALWLLS